MEDKTRNSKKIQRAPGTNQQPSETPGVTPVNPPDDARNTTAQAAPDVDATKPIEQPLGPTNMETTVPAEVKVASASGFRGVIGTIAIFLLAPLVAVFLTIYVFQSYEVDGPSMETTLQNQDRLLVYKLPKTWAGLFGDDYIPNRGDIVIFNRDEGFGTTRQLIKRVIGVPGDHIVIQNGSVKVFNDENPMGYDPDEGKDYAKSGGTEGNVDVTVSDDEVFVLGDNRSNSLDSRVFGPIKQSDLNGRLLLRIYPLNKFDSF